MKPGTAFVSKCDLVGHGLVGIAWWVWLFSVRHLAEILSTLSTFIQSTLRNGRIHARLRCSDLRR